MLSRARKSSCKRFLNALKTGEKRGVVTDFSVHSIMVVMGGFSKKGELKTFLSSLSAYKGLSVYTTTLFDELRAVDISQKENLDIDDSIQYSAALKLGVDGIVSFDKHFDKLEIPRIEP
jgi:predicted nucleic acid-binding protein